MGRIFVFSYRRCAGPVGGGQGVTYKLYCANEKYKLISDIVYFFKDISIKHGESAKLTQWHNQTKQRSIKKFIMTRLSGIGLGAQVVTSLNLHLAKKWMKQLKATEKFGEDDIYIFQDFESAYAFCETGGAKSCKRNILVYHQQGDLYTEWCGFTGRKSISYHNFLKKKFIRVVEEISHIGFPSKGAFEGLINSAPYLGGIIRENDIKVLYNGFTKPKQLDIPSNNISRCVEKLKKHNGFKFITVATLNSAKGVELIPPYLGKIKEKYGNILWVIVGNGVKENEVIKGIERYKLEENVVWFKEPLSHDDILNLFDLTDFYILFHRTSIFDYATIEAMAFNNIPILTPIGGNKEVICDNNGILVDDLEHIELFEKRIAYSSVEELKAKNGILQNSRFSEYAFLERYKEISDMLKQGIML